MRVAILESIIMPAGHEVEFDRMIINELKRQGHEPVLMVPENFTFKVDYGVDVIYLEDVYKRQVFIKIFIKIYNKIKFSAIY